MNLRDYETVAERRVAIEKELNTSLKHIGNFSLNETQASAKHCENMIGAIQVPVGIAGPLAMRNGQLTIDNYYVPLATTEGALVASINRGCKAIVESGGVTVISKHIGITRAPVFAVRNIIQGQKLIAWVETNFTKLKEITETTSSHLTLLEIKPWAMGQNVFLRFRYDTQDAMGMNMATIATEKAVEYIEEQTDAICVAVSGNMCVDKKPSYLNFIEGRGYQVSAEAIIPAKKVLQTLKTTPEEIVEVAQRKILYGAILSGSIGANAHMANILSAIFLATGQDIAHVAECSTGVTTVEQHGKDLYISVAIPDLVVGTVGGGTQLETQKEALSILGISGGNEGKNGIKFAEIIGATVLAGELSLLASLAEQSLAIAHKKLGRGEK